MSGHNGVNLAAGLRALWSRGARSGVEAPDPPPPAAEPMPEPMREPSAVTEPWAAPPQAPARPRPTSGVCDPAFVASLLRQVMDPEIGINIVDLGLIYGIALDGASVDVKMSLTTPGCPLSAYMEDNIGRVLWDAPGIDDVDLHIIWEPAWTPEMISRRGKQELGWPV